MDGSAITRSSIESRSLNFSLIYSISLPILSCLCGGVTPLVARPVEVLPHAGASGANISRSSIFFIGVDRTSVSSISIRDGQVLVVLAVVVDFDVGEGKECLTVLAVVIDVAAE